MSTLRVVPDDDGLSLTQRVAEEVRAYMGRRQKTQVQLAGALGLPQSAVSARLRGKIAWRIDELQVVAAVLEVHPAVLLGGTADHSPRGGGSPTPWSPKLSDTQRDCDATILRLESNSVFAADSRPDQPVAA